MQLADLPYPLRLCTELLHFAAFSCEKTQGLTGGEIKKLAGGFFDEAMIAEAVAILTDRSKVDYECQHEWQDIRNGVIESGEACFKCGRLRSGAEQNG